MEHKECRAFAGTTAVALIAIAGFLCIVFAQPDDTITGWRGTQAIAQPQAGDVQRTGELE